MKNSIENDNKSLNIGYDINYKEKLDKSRDQELQSIYGKLKLLKNHSASQDLDGEKLNIQVNLIWTNLLLYQIFI